jgi:hypothetical protein
VKPYYYSGELLTFVRAKWTLARSVSSGVFIGILLLFGVVKLNQSVADTLGAHSASALAAENEILRQQLNLISPRLINLEIKAERLRERAQGLHKFLQSRKPVRDTVSSFTSVTIGLKSPTSVAATRHPRP